MQDAEQQTQQETAVQAGMRDEPALRLEHRSDLDQVSQPRRHLRDAAGSSLVRVDGVEREQLNDVLGIERTRALHAT